MIYEMCLEAPGKTCKHTYSNSKDVFMATSYNQMDIFKLSNAASYTHSPQMQQPHIYLFNRANGLSDIDRAKCYQQSLGRQIHK